jgi:hypothetical protein
MNWCHREPTLDEMLSDSIVRVMEADGVDPQELAAALRQAAGRCFGQRLGCNARPPSITWTSND